MKRRILIKIMTAFPLLSPGCSEVRRIDGESRSEKKRDDDSSSGDLVELQVIVLSNVAKESTPIQSDHKSIENCREIQKLLDKAEKTTNPGDANSIISDTFSDSDGEIRSAISNIPKGSRSVVIHKNRPFRLLISSITTESD